jgi:hypothetical protein
MQPERSTRTVVSRTRIPTRGARSLADAMEEQIVVSLDTENSLLLA